MINRVISESVYSDDIHLFKKDTFILLRYINPFNEILMVTL